MDARLERGSEKNDVSAKGVFSPHSPGRFRPLPAHFGAQLVTVPTRLPGQRERGFRPSAVGFGCGPSRLWTLPLTTVSGGTTTRQEEPSRSDKPRASARAMARALRSQVTARSKPRVRCGRGGQLPVSIVRKGRLSSELRERPWGTSAVPLGRHAPARTGRRHPILAGRAANLPPSPEPRRRHGLRSPRPPAPRSPRRQHRLSNAVPTDGQVSRSDAADELHGGAGDCR
jgi:hypothetical protein